MDEAERVAQQHLLARALGPVEYEPDGNVTPDFVIDGRIAVEVRRLIQHERGGPVTRGLDETTIPLLMRMRRQLAAHGPPVDEHSWFVYYRFKRPLEPWKLLEREISSRLATFRNSERREPVQYGITAQFSLDLFRASTAFPQMFVLGGYSDGDSGGWLLSELQRNAAICIEEKSRKIAARRHLYPEWWLVLIDHVGLGLDDFDREQLRALPRLAHDWDAVVVVDPRDPTRWYTL
jgi:hypothetical protein